jgi:hypothetical protein
MESIGPLMATALREPIRESTSGLVAGGAGRKVHGGIRQCANRSDPVACRSVKIIS